MPPADEKIQFVALSIVAASGCRMNDGDQRGYDPDGRLARAIGLEGSDPQRSRRGRRRRCHGHARESPASPSLAAGSSGPSEFPQGEHRPGASPCPLTRKITGKVKFSPSSATSGGGCGTGSERSHHGQRRFVKGGIARTLDDSGRQTWPRPVEHEAHIDLGALSPNDWRIALVPVEMRDQLLLPGHPLAARFAGAVTGAPTRPSGIASASDVAVASAATDSVEARFAPPRSWDRLPSASSTRSASRSDPALRLSVGMSLGRSVSLTSAFCSASAGEATDASVSGPGGRSVGFAVRRCHLETDLDRRCAETSSVVGPVQMRDRQRHAAEMQRQRRQRRRKPTAAAKVFARCRRRHSLIALLRACGAAAARPRPARLRAPPA